LRQEGALARQFGQRPLGQGAAAERDMASFRRAQTGQRAHQRTLAGAVAADDAPAFAFMHLPVEIRDQLALAGFQ